MNGLHGPNDVCISNDSLCTAICFIVLSYCAACFLLWFWASGDVYVIMYIIWANHDCLDLLVLCGLTGSIGFVYV